MTKTVSGGVHGNTIELAEDIGVADGQRVEVVVRVTQCNGEWGEGIQRSAGGWADYPEMDEIMEQIQRYRNRDGGRKNRLSRFVVLQRFLL